MAFAAIAFFPGLAFGSFLNVVAARIPLRRSLVSPGSACMACGTPLAWYDNIPLLSFALLRGRCRHCQAAILVAVPARRGDDGSPRRRVRAPLRAHLGRRSRRVLLRHARRDLGHGCRAAHHSRTGSSCRPRPSCSRPTRCSTRRWSGRWRASALRSSSSSPRSPTPRAWAWATSSSPCCSA